MSAFDSFPLGQPAFITHILDRAAHLRSDDEKLLALEGHRDARAYVVYRDSLVVKQDADGPRPLLTIPNESAPTSAACHALSSNCSSVSFDCPLIAVSYASDCAQNLQSSLHPPTFAATIAQNFTSRPLNQMRILFAQ